MKGIDGAERDLITVNNGQKKWQIRIDQKQVMIFPEKSADAGHTPWKLDPVFVAHVFVNLKMSTEGITGEYPVQYDKLVILQNTGITAIVEIGDSNSTVGKVYLKRLIRKDSTGIWTVVGYDPADKKQ